MKTSHKYIFLASLKILITPEIYLVMVFLSFLLIAGVICLHDTAPLERVYIEKERTLVVAICLVIIPVVLASVLWWIRCRVHDALRELETPKKLGLRLLPWGAPLVYTLLLILIAYCLVSWSYDWALVLIFGLPSSILILPFAGGMLTFPLLIFIPLLVAFLKLVIGLFVEHNSHHLE